MVGGIKVGGAVGANTLIVDGVSNESSVALDTLESVGVPESRGVAAYADSLGIDVRKVGGTDASVGGGVVDSICGAAEAGQLGGFPIVGKVAGNTSVVGINILCSGGAHT